MQAILRTLFVLLVAASLPGCLIMSTNTEVVEPTAKRVAVEFESPEGLELFHTRVTRDTNAGKTNLGTDSFAIPFIIGASTTRVLSENAYYNQQVSKADINADGSLSDAEVRLYVGVK